MLSLHYIFVSLMTFNKLQIGKSGITKTVTNIDQATSLVDDIHRIVGGDFANPGEIKYIVATLHNELAYLCGGGVIDNYWILTAAHCVYNNDQFEDVSMAVVAGVIDFNDLEDPRRVKVNVSQIYIPEEYTSTDDPYDIALLRLNNSLDIEKNDLEKLALPTEPLSLTNRMATTAGFGYDQYHRYYTSTSDDYIETGNTSGLLRKADVKIISNSKCQNIYNRVPIYNSYLCGKMVKAYQIEEYGICDGDSGSPLVYNNTVVGIVSWSFGCDEREFPLIYTRVSEFLDFIENAKKNNTHGMKVKIF